MKLLSTFEILEKLCLRLCDHKATNRNYLDMADYSVALHVL